MAEVEEKSQSQQEKGNRAKEEGSRGRLTEEMQKVPAAQHEPGLVFRAGKSNKFFFVFVQMRNRLPKTKTTDWGGSMKVTQGAYRTLETKTRLQRSLNTNCSSGSTGLLDFPGSVRSHGRLQECLKTQQSSSDWQDTRKTGGLNVKDNVQTYKWINNRFTN